MEVELVCEPVFDYGRTAATWTMVGGDRHAADASGAGQTMRLRSDLALGIEGDRVRARHVLQAGDRAYCALSWAEELATPQDADEAEARIAATVRFWRSWLGRARIPDHRFRDPLQRSALAIKGLTYMPTGATVAALTTSLPETPGGERNWDYRYTWMRDTTFTLQALHYLHLDWEADEFMQFVARPRAERGRSAADHVRDRRPPRPDGDDARRSHRLRRRAARSASATVRSTSARTTSSARCSTRSCSTRDRAGGCRGGSGRSCSRRRSARPASGRHPTRASGRRGASRSTTSRRSSCAGSLSTAPRSWQRSAATPSCRRSGERPPRRSARTSSRTGSTVEACCASTTRRMPSTPRRCSPRIFGFLPGDDERMRATVLAIADELTEDGFVLRYRTDETDDGLSGKEGTFLICSFWLVSALAIVGEIQRARDLMERLLRIASPLGLYAEEFDADTGRHLGNFPQAFSHLALIEAAARIIVAERLEEICMDSYDVVIIGTGAGGGTLARHLAPSGKRILLLERGDWLPARAAELAHAGCVRREPLHLAGHVVRRAKASRSSRRSTTSSAERRSSTARRSIGSARRTSASCSTTTGSRPRGRSPTTSSSRTTPRPSSCTRCTARGARIRPSRGRARRTRTRPSRTSRGSSSSRTTSRRRATSRSTRPAGSCWTSGHAEQHVHPLRELRRLSVPCPREVRRGGARRAPGARARKRHAPDRTRRSVMLGRTRRALR